MADRWLHCPTCQEFIRLEESKDLKKTFCGGCGRLFSQVDVLPSEGWVYAQNRQKIGPLTLEQLQQRASAGQLQATDMVLQPGKARWTPAATFVGMFPQNASPVVRRPAPPPTPAKPVAVEPILVDPVVKTAPARPAPVQPILVEPIAVEPMPPAAVVVTKSTMKAVPVEPILVEPQDLATAKSPVKVVPVEPIVVEPFDLAPAKPVMVEPVAVQPIVEISQPAALSVAPTVQPAKTPPPSPAQPPPVSMPSPVPPPLPPVVANLTPPVPPPAAAAAPPPPPVQPAAPVTIVEAVPAPLHVPQTKPVFVEPIFVDPQPMAVSAPPTFPVTPIAVDPIPVEPEAPFVPSSEVEPAVVEPMSAQAPDWTVAPPPSPPPPVTVDVVMPAVETTIAEPPSPPGPPRELGWFFVRYGQKLGPVTLPELQEMVSAGQLWPTDMVMKEETSDWQPATTVPGLFPEEEKKAAETPALVEAKEAPKPAVSIPTEPAPTTAPVPMPRWPSVPNYEILAELHRGERWVIYKAEHVTLKKTLALKILNPEREFGADEFMRLRKGADASTRLRHPGIVQVEAVGEIEGRPYLALEYVEAPRLKEQMIGLPWPAKSAARLVQLLAEATDYAHERGLVHGHLQPAQVVMPSPSSASDAGQPKITGFGVAEPFEVTRVDAASLNYVAPEQVGGQASQERSSDIYALGMLLYELLTGQTPFRGATAADTVDLVQSVDPVSPCRLQPRVPLDLDTICLKCLQKHPDMRYATAGALAEDLRRHLAGERIRARPIVLAVRGLGWLRQHPREAAIAALSFLLLVMVLARNFGSGNQKELIEARQQAEREAKAAHEARATLEETSAALVGQSSTRKQLDAELENYRKVLGAMVEQLRQAPDAELAYSVLWMSVIDARNPADTDHVLDAVEKLLAQHPKCPPRFLVLRGAALYRAGRFDAALRALNEALLAGPEPPVAAWLFLAMTEQRLRHPEAARDWLDKAQRWSNEKPLTSIQLLEIDLLRREAENLISGTN